MKAPESSDMQEARRPLSLDYGREIAALRQLGADQFDPVRLHYLEVLASRVNAHQGHVQRLLGAKLAQALVVFRGQFEQARSAAQETIAQAAPSCSQVAAELQRLLDGGDFTGVKRCIAKLERRDQRESLGDLARSLAQPAPGPGDGHLDGHVGSRPELKSVQQFRKTWSRLSAEKQVTQALGQAPQNAGPMNSHLLVLRSLALMRDLSPDYLNRFVSYVDTLLCLEQGDEAKHAAAKKTAAGDNGKKLKDPRGRSRKMPS